MTKRKATTTTNESIDREPQITNGGRYAFDPELPKPQSPEETAAFIARLENIDPEATMEVASRYVEKVSAMGDDWSLASRTCVSSAKKPTLSRVRPDGSKLNIKTLFSPPLMGKNWDTLKNTGNYNYGEKPADSFDKSKIILFPGYSENNPYLTDEFKANARAWFEDLEQAQDDLVKSYVKYMTEKANAEEDPDKRKAALAKLPTEESLWYEMRASQEEFGDIPKHRATVHKSEDGTFVSTKLLFDSLLKRYLTGQPPRSTKKPTNDVKTASRNARAECKASWDFVEANAEFFNLSSYELSEIKANSTRLVDYEGDPKSGQLVCAFNYLPWVSFEDSYQLSEESRTFLTEGQAKGLFTLVYAFEYEHNNLTVDVNIRPNPKTVYFLGVIPASGASNTTKRKQIC